MKSGTEKLRRRGTWKTGSASSARLAKYRPTFPIEESQRVTPNPKLENDVDLAHGFFDFPEAFSVGFEEKGVAAGKMNGFFAVCRKAATPLEKMHDFGLLDRAPIRPRRAFENTGIDGFAATDHRLHPRHPDRRRAGQAGRAPILESLKTDALFNLLNLHGDPLEWLEKMFLKSAPPSAARSLDLSKPHHRHARPQLTQGGHDQHAVVVGRIHRL